MKRQFISLVTVVIALIVVGCATTKTQYNPFKIDQDKFYAKTKTIALAPLVVYVDLEPSEQVISSFESLIEKKLSEAGFSVVPSKEYRDIWKRMTEQIGGYFDPVTGKRDKSKFKTVKEHCLRELNKKFSGEAVLFPAIIIVKASFYQGAMQVSAKWDGVEEPIDIRSGFVRFLDITRRSGTVGALSLAVMIKDINETTLYVNRGGIQVLHRLGKDFFIKGFDPVPKNELLVNEERNAAAVNIALDPLIQKSESPK